MVILTRKSQGDTTELRDNWISPGDTKEALLERASLAMNRAKGHPSLKRPVRLV
jgi:hypothetical protein